MNQLEIRSPYDQSVVARVAQADSAQLEQAICAAVAAFETTRHLATFERQKILRSVAAAIAGNKEEFAKAICREAGKPIRTARAEVERAIFTFEDAAEECGRLEGEMIPLDRMEAGRGRWAMVRRFPIGPIAAITPFNFPLNLVCHKVAPAIASGCTMVLKPAPQTPTAALMLAEIVVKAGWPAGALSVLPMSNEVAAPLIEDDRLKMLTFTGSAAAGWAMKQRSGKKKVTLELGGNAGCIIHSDADLELAATRCAIGGFSYAGQSCISVQRILVENRVFDEFLSVFVSKVRALKTGDPADEKTDVGPLIRESDVARVDQWVSEAIAEGAKTLCGGHRNGWLYEPTVLTNTKTTQKVNCMEVFAPVVTVERYTDFDEAIREVNRSSFGLQAGVFTCDIERVHRAFAALEVGGVIANDVPTFRMDNMPYGGLKDSGMGREGARYAIEEMTERKTLVVHF